MSDNEWKTVHQKRKRRSNHANGLNKALKNALTDSVPDEISPQRIKALMLRIKKLIAEMKPLALVRETKTHLDQLFGASSSSSSDAEAVELYHLDIVCYGLGSFSSSRNALFQLAFIVALYEAYENKEPTSDTTNKSKRIVKFQIFDPVMNKSDKALASSFQLEVLTENEGGKRAIDGNTLFYMPHCGKSLYQNVLQSNWSDQLSRIVLLGNSFEAYNDRLLGATARKSSVLVGVCPFLCEKALPWQVSKSHPEFHCYEAAFNDLSLHFFPAQKVRSALQNPALTLLVKSASDDPHLQ